MHRPFLTLALCLTFLSTGRLAFAEDWPQWHGPRRDLVSTETDWRSDWSDDAPEVVWRAQVGTGFATVAVSQGLLYTLGHDGGRDTVWCLNATTGKPEWQHSWKGKLVDNLHEGGPGATPTVAGEHVFTCSKEGILICFERTKGRVVWKKDIRVLSGTKMPTWGFSGSAWIDGDRLYIDAGALLALDRKNGKLIWKTKKYLCGYGSPIVFEHSGKSYVSVLNNDGLLVATPSGEVRDLFKWPTSYKTNSTTPIWSDGKLFISTGYNKGCALVSFDGKDLERVYENKSMRNHMNNCVLLDGHLYGFDGNSNSRRTVKLVCLEFATGEVQWTKMGFGCGSLMGAGDKLIVLGDRGDLAVVAASPREFREISRTKVLDGKCWTMPVLSNGRIYCRNSRGALVCVGVRG